MAFEEFSGRSYLKIDIANSYGKDVDGKSLDKKDWADRLAWFDRHEPQLESMQNQADKPALFFGGLKAYRQIAEGKPTGYPVGLDATSSGLQILTVLTGDRYAAEVCNVVDTGHRMNAYGLIYENMLQRMNSQSEKQRKLDPEDVKHAIMTSLFGSTREPKRVFGKGALLSCFEQVMQERCPAVWELNEWLLNQWDPTVLSHDWVLPDNFHVHIKVMGKVEETVQFFGEPYEIIRRINQPTFKGRSLGANLTHSVDGMVVRELTRRCMHDPIQVERVRRMLDQPATRWQQKVDSQDDQLVVLLWNHFQDCGFLSARILDHLNYRNLGHVDPREIRVLLDNLPPRPFNIMVIHDCFRVLPNYGNELRKQYNLMLHLLAKSDLLNYLLKQIVGLQTPINKLDEDLAQDILGSNYSLS